MPKLFVATTSLVIDGVSVTVGDTITEGHPLMRGREAFFAPFKPTFTHSEPPQRTSIAPSSPVARRPAVTRPKPKA
ncbi:MAG: hypothetical protein IT341_10625 [Chloroflexi bacterium]|nr:hypothetical protein [Chloroflexota bacterium]